MAAIVLISDQQFDGKRLYKHVMDFLPRYAQPRFVRIMVKKNNLLSYAYDFVSPAKWPSLIEPTKPLTDSLASKVS